jgi:disulfide bond formation protein DsbB
MIYRSAINNRISPFLVIVLLIITGLFTPMLAQATSNGPGTSFVYIIVALVLMGSLMSILGIKSALERTQWSLADAVSEEVELTARDVSGNLMLDTSGKPIMETKLSASTSRLVALLGTIVLLFMFVGFGAFAMVEFGMTGELPESISQVVEFMLAGLTLFAPYAVNKVSSLFASIGPK